MCLGADDASKEEVRRREKGGKRNIKSRKSCDQQGCFRDPFA